MTGNETKDDMKRCSTSVATQGTMHSITADGHQKQFLILHYKIFN
jgi:hypothetical protein